MSVLINLSEAGKRMRDDHVRARRRWQDGGSGGVVTGECNGHKVIMRYEGSSRSSDFRSVEIDGHLFARETETVPWNVFRPITVGYTVFLDLSLETATRLIEELNLTGKVSLDEEWYPSTNGPIRYYAHCKDFDHVIQLWEVWKLRYLDK